MPRQPTETPSGSTKTCPCCFCVIFCYILLSFLTIYILGIEDNWAIISITDSQQKYFRLISAVIVTILNGILLLVAILCAKKIYCPKTQVYEDTDNRSLSSSNHPTDVEKADYHGFKNEQQGNHKRLYMAQQLEIERVTKEKQDMINTLQQKIEGLTDNQKSFEETMHLLQNQKQTQQKQYQTKSDKLKEKNKRLKQELITLQSTDGTDDINTMKEGEIIELNTEIHSLKTQNNKLREQLQQTITGKGIESAFIKEEDFATKKMSLFRQQTLNNLHDDLVDELSEKYEDLEDDEESTDDDSKNDIHKVIAEETDTKTRFEMLTERVGFEFLFDVLMMTYDEMVQRKARICDVISKQMNIKSNKQHSAQDIAAVLIHPQLQQQWEEYLNKSMQNMYNIEIGDRKAIVDNVFMKICGHNVYKHWKFIETGCKRKIKHYISECCEICWIMILSKPELTFYPSSFRFFVDNEHFYNEKKKYDLWTGSKTKGKAKILYFAIPTVMQTHILNPKQKLDIIKGTLFAHNEKGVMQYIMSDPQKLLDELSDSDAPDV